MGTWSVGLSFQTPETQKAQNYIIIRERFSSVVCRISYEEGREKKKKEKAYYTEKNIISVLRKTANATTRK